MKAYNINDFAILIGIDWVNTKLDICELPINTQKYHYCIIKGKPGALNYLARSLKLRYPNQQIAVDCELKKSRLFMP